MVLHPTFRGLSHELTPTPSSAPPPLIPEAAPPPEPQSINILEENQRLSQSLLWQLQRNYFSQQGIEAWNTGAVPHYVTSNPTIARAYANVILAYLRDCHDQDRLDCHAPFYILELGSGSGRFAFHFLQYLVPCLANLGFPHPPVIYLMTDLAQANLDYWRNHAHLQPFLDSGHLDFAQVDATHIHAITLSQREQTLTAETLTNPLAVIANYFFDCLPQDAFIIQNGTLYESLVTLATSNPYPELTDADLINHIDLTYTHHETTTDYYDNSQFNALLADYQQTLDETCLLFPKVALECLDQLRHLTQGQFFFLTADKGYSHETDLQFRQPPMLARHGNAFSLMVNYHAIGQYTRQLGGAYLNASHRHGSINIGGLLFSDAPSTFPQTDRTFAEKIINGGPDDFFALKKAVEPHLPDFTLSQLLAYLRLSHWDAHIFCGCFPAIMAQLDPASQQLWPDLRSAIHKIWAGYYPIGETRDLAFHCGMLLYSIQAYGEAITYFQYSSQHYGDDASTRFNLGMCHYRLDQTTEALEHFDQAIAMEPAFKPHVDAVAHDIRSKQPNFPKNLAQG